MSLLRAFLLVVSVAFGATFAAADTAEAKIVIVNTGDEIFEVGPLPPPWDANPELVGWNAGYKCGVFGVFWAYVVTWGCDPVAYRDDTYDDSPELVADVTSVYSEDDIQMGWWGKNGRWLLAGLIVVGVVTGAAGDDD